MPDHSIVSPDDQRATFVELFFDLVFVFAVTGVTPYAALHLDALGILRAVAIFWLIWWGWTQFTWALNAANTEHAGVRATTLVATAIAAAMAVSVEGAFSAERSPSVAFAVSYLAVRVIGLGLFLRVVFHDERERSAVSLLRGRVGARPSCGADRRLPRSQRSACRVDSRRPDPPRRDGESDRGRAVAAQASGGFALPGLS
jgi:low temperature requirement protein LtrA